MKTINTIRLSISNGTFLKLLNHLEKRVAKDFGIPRSKVTAYWNGQTFTITISR